MTSRSFSIRAVFEFLVVAVCTVAFAMTALSILASMLSPNSAGTHDFVEYWASGHQLAQRANPYDAEALQKLERSAGFPQNAPTLIMGNPPPALLLVLPLGWLGATVGEWLWLALLLASLVASVQMIRSSYGFRKAFQEAPLHLLAYAFAPVLACLLAAQVALFLTLGLVLFLRWHRSRPFCAGASIWLCLLKPHLFVPFGVVLLLWIFLTRSYRILAGIVTALAVSSAVVSALNPHIWAQYQSMMREQRIDRLELPCLSIALRQYVYPHTLWLQCLPAAIGCVWAIAYLRKRQAKWDWLEHSPMLMLVSVLAAPYSWCMDQTVLLPALLAGLYVTSSRTWIAILALMSAVIEIAALRGVALGSPFYLWTAPAWLIWYLLANRNATKSP